MCTWIFEKQENKTAKTECLDSLAVEDVALAVERVLARNDALVAST